MHAQRSPASNLGRTQKLVLRLFATTGENLSARQLEYHWPSLTESAAAGAIQRLGRRSLVDVAGWEDPSNRRTYRLTEKGWAVANVLDDIEEEDA